MFENCILITIDSLRADHLSCYGYKNIETSNIDELASGGIMFTNAYANSSGTPSSFPAILTSTYPMMYGGYKKLSKFRPYLPKMLKRESVIRTIGINSNPYLSRYFGYDKGFDFFYDVLSGKKVNTTKKIITKKIELIKRFFGNVAYTPGYMLNKTAKCQIERAKNKRFFLWIHYMDVHIPYAYKNKLKNIIYYKKLKEINNLIVDVSRGKKIEIAENLLSEIVALYDEGIKRVDEIIEDILKFLRTKEIIDSTLIILTADHGEEFMEHGGLCHMPKLYDELLHIPFIIYNPSLSRSRVDKLVSQLDIAPTIAEMLGITKPKLWLGRNILERLKDNIIISEVSNDNLSPEVKYNEWKIAVRTKKWKLHYFLKNNKFELYNIVKDPKETNNIAEIKPNIVNALKPTVEEHMRFVKRTNFNETTLKARINQLKLKWKI